LPYQVRGYRADDTVKYQAKMPKVLMAVYTIRQSGDKSKTTLTIVGRVTSVDWEALREICLYTLKNKDTVVLDLEKVSEHDVSLTVFVCLLARSVQLLGKRMTILGKREEFFCLYSKGAHCSDIEACTRYRCESLFDRSTE
jgi:anti-anti-sigma regulatory factor